MQGGDLEEVLDGVDLELVKQFIGLSTSRNPEKRRMAFRCYDFMDVITKTYVQTNPAISCYYRALKFNQKRFKRGVY
jgi:hypothetical protein